MQIKLERLIIDISGVCKRDGEVRLFICINRAVFLKKNNMVVVGAVVENTGCNRSDRTEREFHAQSCRVSRSEILVERCVRFAAALRRYAVRNEHHRQFATDYGPQHQWRFLHARSIHLSSLHKKTT